ncbi:efflux RND transporter periplasmic adaptor subunit [Paenibacillus sp. YYML68]|uniref:efflux RND transporter periplasmic adaptor subunit n=1 Tax=Paenibacillus sp. YYML68 TaxID=2909250 RepID=UPI002491D552|nr:efflux RND transporter periplasmic adaptor subunit [Paenibacillus sp. YYML68]
MSTRWWMGNLSTLKTAVKPVLAVCVAVTLTAAMTTGCSVLPKEEEEEVLPAIQPPKLSKKPEYVVKSQTLETKLRGSGKLMATVEEELYFTDETSRRLKAVHVKNGDQVEQGQLIAELDVTELESQLKQKRLQTRKDELTMIETLRNADGKSAEELEQAKIDFELKREELVKLESTIAKAKLTAPFSGTIVSVPVKKGDSVKAYDAIATIADLSQLTVAATLSQDDLKKIAVGMEAIVDINSAGQHKGTVHKLPSPKESGQQQGGGDYYSGDRQSGSESIENYVIIKLEPFPEGLNRGTPLGLTVITQRKENAIVIPLAALRSYAGRNYVQVIDDKGSKREVDVELGQQTATEVEIVQGLTPGQKVVGR